MDMLKIETKPADVWRLLALVVVAVSLGPLCDLIWRRTAASFLHFSSSCLTAMPSRSHSP